MFETKAIEECGRILKTDLQNGLTENEALRRKNINGENKLETSKDKRIISIFFQQLRDPMIYILIASSIISFLLKEISDSIIIVIVILLNSVIGTYQEYKANKSLTKLKELSKPMCFVKRNGKIFQIESKDLTIGDILQIEAGNTVAADIRLINDKNLKIDESALTGETLPSLKNSNAILNKTTHLGDRINMAYMSTNVVSGKGEGIVVAIGMQTEIGKIAKALKNEKIESTPLQKELNKLSKILGIFTVIVCFLLFVIAIIQKRSKYSMLLNSISLGVAAIPEGLPAVVTIVLALGVQRMTKVNAIVKKLPSVETLGMVNVVCSDKTGTLTQNKMNVTAISINNTIYNKDYLPLDLTTQQLLDDMILCNDSNINDNNKYGDSTELALLEFCNQFKNISDIKLKSKRIDEIPFDSNRKMMSILCKNVNGKVMYSKGSLESILKISNKIYIDNKEMIISEEIKNKILEISNELTSRALRVLAFSIKKTNEIKEKDMTFIGMVGLIDPPRKETIETIKTFNEAGITTVMITGDHVDTAFEIAKQLGIAKSKEECITGEYLDNIQEKDLNKIINNMRVYARVTPEHKMKIVKAYKENNKIVAMTGDGVNDAPSLKSSNVGIAMGRCGTEVAKEAADIILADDNFSTIGKAIEEGRTIYTNIRKTVLFLLSSNFAEIVTMFLAILLNLPMPLIAIHILWVNLLTDSMPALALGNDPMENDVMKEKPRESKENVFGKNGIACIMLYGMTIGLLTIFAFLSPAIQNLVMNGQIINLENIKLILKDGQILTKSQTYAFVTLSTSELIHAIGMKNIKKSFVEKEFLNNKLLNITLVVSVALELLVVNVSPINTIFKMTSIDLFEWIYLISSSSLILIIHEVFLIFFRKKE